MEQHNDKGRWLTALARYAIAEKLGLPGPSLPATSHPDWLNIPAATFVTLTQHGALRGCIGTLEAHRPLLADVQHNARAAAFGDPRFAPLSAAEFATVRVEVSVLTPATPLTFRDEADALAQLQPGVDGVILEAGRHRATFLPQVWDQLPEPVQFMAQLKRKAGLAANDWPADMRLSRYRVEKFVEADPS